MRAAHLGPSLVPDNPKAYPVLRVLGRPDACTASMPTTCRYVPRGGDVDDVVMSRRYVAFAPRTAPGVLGRMSALARHYRAGREHLRAGDRGRGRPRLADADIGFGRFVDGRRSARVARLPRRFRHVGLRAAGWESSTTLLEESWSRICLPPGPSMMSLRNRAPASRRRATTALRPPTMRWMRFQPPDPGSVHPALAAPRSWWARPAEAGVPALHVGERRPGAVQQVGVEELGIRAMASSTSSTM